MPAMYETTPTSVSENLTQGDTTQFQIMIKPILRQSEIQHPNLILQPTPCGLDYDIKPVGNDTITQNNENKFDVTLKTSDYVPPGKYFVIIYNNLSQPGYPEQYMDEIAGFVLNVVQK